MATLYQVYTNLTIGGVVMSTCFIAFGIAVGLECNKNLTPRAWARPIKVIKNCLNKPYCLSWISWAMSLRYIDLLSGIPGTGTREEGRSGPTLRTNLDGIVLLRYHVLQFKVSLLATVLGMIMLLPLYYTSQCDPLESGVNVCKEIDARSDFEQLTMANVPPHYQLAVSNNGTIDALNETTSILLDSNYSITVENYNYTLDDIDLFSIRLTWIWGITERYMACTATIVLITLYTCYLLWHEWIECLALRRVYYLESEYYEERLDELNETFANTDPEDPFQKVRPPFLPHPEMRETIPNVSLHSALYKLPSNLCTNYEPNGDNDQSLLERQLEAAAGFFDQCIPPQDGFTSSIVAVTMVPDATKLTKVWGKWYVLGNKMRRIRYIQHQLEIRKEMKRTGKKGFHDFFVVAPVCVAGQALKATTEGIEAMTEKINEGIGSILGNQAVNDGEESKDKDEDKKSEPRTSVMNDTIVVDTLSNKEGEFRDVEAFVKCKDDIDTVGGNEEIMGTISSEESTSKSPDSKKRKQSYTSAIPGRKTFEYDEFDPVAFTKWIGYTEETKLDQLIDTLEIEQLSVFARETSQSASNPCVYGVAPESLRFASIEQLESMLIDTWESAREANDVLLEARAEMFLKVGGREVDISSIKKHDDKIVGAANDLKLPSTDIEKPETQGEHEAGNILKSISEEKNMKYEEEIPISFNIGGQKSDQPNGLRQRGKQKSIREKYYLAQDLVKESNAISHPTTFSGREVKRCCPSVIGRESVVAKSLKSSVLDHPSYCVVTFTSRQAAVAARQCLVDGKGVNSWEQVTKIPMNPLADAPPRTPCFCRGCCRPVTLTISHQEKRTRKICVWSIYILFCFLYTVPLSFVSQITNPTWLAEALPNSEILQDPDSFFFKALAGFSSGYVYTLFFSILPQVFKLLAMSEGTSSSKVDAEEKALRFYWYFMLLTAFTGSFLLQLLLASILEGNLSDEFRDILEKVATSMTTQQAPVWLNWIIVRTFNVLPANYLLQAMTFVYGWLRIHWLNRVMRGGGPGGPPPYRIYIDSGVVFMCITSMAPIVPIIAPAAALYYLLFIPLLRWLHIFVYRPFYDGGGNRLPIIHEIIISSLILGQTLLGTVHLLKQSLVFGSFIVLMPIPTYFFSEWTKEKFLRSYEDAALWQTSNLDGLIKHGTMQEREKYRHWLVDAHKASYVPICVSGGQDFLTIQPAAVIPMSKDMKRFSTPRKVSPTGKKVAEGGAF